MVTVASNIHAKRLGLARTKPKSFWSPLVIGMVVLICILWVTRKQAIPPATVDDNVLRRVDIPMPVLKYDTAAFDRRVPDFTKIHDDHLLKAVETGKVEKKTRKKPEGNKMWNDSMTGKRTEFPFTYDVEEYRSLRRIPDIYVRDHLANILQYEKLTTAAELGVLRGGFARILLTNWTLATDYLLVDAWQQLENYDDVNNVAPVRQNKNYMITMERLQRWNSVIRTCKNFTDICAQLESATSKSKPLFDFVYVDARHDYKGVLVDLQAWWPLIRDGGIMAGHDYVFQKEGPEQTGQNWTINFDGSVDPLGRAVKGAVREFFGDPSKPDRFRIIHTTRRREYFPTWIVRK